MNSTIPTPRAKNIPNETILSYRRDGFVKVEGILTDEEAAFYYEEGLRIAKDNQTSASEGGVYRKILNQKVNVWRESHIMKALTFHPNVTRIAKQLAGVPLRLWHDQILAKDPQNGKQTEWHQDQPYWPHNNSRNPISIWIALCDVPAHKGSMSFIPGQQHRDDLKMQILSDDKSLFGLAPELEYEPKITLPLRAGECTFHHGRCPHMANANSTDEYRVAHVAIYIDRDTVYDPDVPGHASKHVVTDPLQLISGSRLDGEMFPEI